MRATKISFEDILPIWENKLWPNRESAIEGVSAMTWPYEGNPDPIDMNIFDYQPTFYGVYIDNKLVGVNSGHRTSDAQYRSRGIWVDPEYRKKGVAQLLFVLTEHQARIEQCEMLWSIPRKTALTAYTKFGFTTVGDFIITETADANIYVKKVL
jgi:GNAT superfamily N-acetyltransferase